MTVYKCKICGGNLEIIEGVSVCTCEYCGTEQTLPRLDSDRKVNLYDRANHFRRNGDFDKAMGIYEQILNEDTMDSEAYWSIVLCKYGIEYIEDPASHTRIPTVNRTQYTSVYADEDYKAALEYADSLQKHLYEKEAQKIDEIQKGILTISEKEEPFDIFLCYKETDTSGNRTQDSVLANDIYYNLTNEGFHVFFSRISLEKVIGQSYEPYIFAALNSARVMVVIGTKPEHFQAVWVRNEWSRFLALSRHDPNKILVPAYRDMDPYDLPEEFSHLQAQDMGKLGFMQDLIRGIEKMLSRDVQKVEERSASSTVQDDRPGVASLLRRGELFLEDGEWENAYKYFDKVLDIDPENAEAYLGQLLTVRRVHNHDELINHENTFDREPLYQKALRFADDDFRTVLVQLAEENKRKEKENKRTAEEKRRKKQEEQWRQNQEYRKYIAPAANCIAVSNHTVGLKVDGTVIAVGRYYSACTKVSDWTDIEAIAVGDEHTAGLKGDGSVVVDGGNSYGECNVPGWTDIIAISAGRYHTVGLKKDGSVVAVGRNDFGECDVSDWIDIEVIVGGDHRTIGLKRDGSVVAVGRNEYGECDVSDWTDIVTIAGGADYTVGLKKDGSVVAVGKNEYGECNVSDWTDIVAIDTKSAAYPHTVGLRRDGSVIAVGDNRYCQCNVFGWTDIVAISAGRFHTVGLKKDGRVVAVGYNSYGECNVSDWTDIVAVFAGYQHTVGLRSDGRVMAVGWDQEGQCRVSDWKLFQSLNTLEQDRLRRLEEKLDKELEIVIAEIEHELYSLALNEKKSPIFAYYDAQKQPLIKALTDRLKANDDERQNLKEKKNNLEQQLSALGLFQLKEKAAIREQIAALDTKIKALPSDQNIRQEYASQISEIDLQEKQEIQELEKSIRENHSMPKADDFIDSDVRLSVYEEKMHKFLEDEQWYYAEKFARRILDQDPNRVSACWGMLMAWNHYHNKSSFLQMKDTRYLYDDYNCKAIIDQEDFNEILVQIKDNYSAEKDKIDTKSERFQLSNYTVVDLIRIDRCDLDAEEVDQWWDSLRINKSMYILESPYIGIYAKDDADIQDLLPMLERAVQAKKEFVIFIYSYVREVRATLIVNALRNTFHGIVVEVDDIVQIQHLMNILSFNEKEDKWVVVDKAFIDPEEFVVIV